MTTLVKGPIKLVTDRPDTVRKINLRAPELRLHGAGIVTDHNDDIPVRDGQVEFEALPGPAVLTLVTAGGAPLRSVDIVVPDEDTATLAECLDQIYVYDPPVVGRAQQFAREAGEHAARAEAGAARVGSAEQVGQWVGEAEVLHDDTVAAAEHAETQAGVAAEQAGVAAGHAEQAGVAGTHRQKAEEAEGSAHAAAGAAADSAELSEDAAAVSVAAAAGFMDFTPEQVIDAATRSESARDDVIPLAEQVHNDATATASHRERVDGQVDAIDTAFTDSIPPYLQPDSPEGLGASYRTAVVALRNPATGLIDPATLQNAADRAKADGRPLYAEGTVNTTDTLRLECSGDLSSLTVNHSGGGSAVRVGSRDRSTTRIDLKLPKVFSRDHKPSSDDSWTDGSIGVEIVNLRGSWVTIPVVQGFHTGVYVHAVGPGPCGYNSFILGEIWQSWTGMKLYHDTEGYTNENNFFGGRFQSPRNGYAHIVLDGDTSLQEINSVNNNRFWGTSLEGGQNDDGTKSLEYSVDFGSAAHNIFLDCRFERTPGVRFSSKASRNRIDGGFGAFGLLDRSVREPGEEFNEIDSARVRSTSQELQMRSQFREYDSIRLKPAQSRIEIGPGTVEPSASINASGSSNISITAGNFLPADDNRVNLGYPGKGWKDVYISGRVNVGGVWLRSNSGALEVSASSSGPWHRLVGEESITPASGREQDANRIVRTQSDGHLHSFASPTAYNHLTRKGWVEALVNQRPALFSGPGDRPPLSSVNGAVVGDKWLNESTGKITTFDN